MKPLLLINFKTYPEATGKHAVDLAKKIASVKTKKYVLAVAPPQLELEHVRKQVKINVFAQHVDAEVPGAHTGQITAVEVRKLGVDGTILNHAEHKLSLLILKKTIRECQRAKLLTVVCAANLKELRSLAKLHPEYIAYEPPQLIGGNISVTSAKPEVIQNAVRLVRKLSPSTKVLCGAGVHSSEDLRQALRLGTEGVLLSHAIVKVKNPQKVLQEFISQPR